MIVVRDRDSHAWVSAFINGKWETVDTTPPSWVVADKKFGSLFEPLSDFFSFIGFSFSKWRASARGDFVNYWYLILPLLFILYWLFFRKSKTVIVKIKKDDVATLIEKPGIDSPFYKLEEKINEMGLKRLEWESYSVWFDRLEEEGHSIGSIDLLKRSLMLHSRFRFDPVGISDVEMGEMERIVVGWIEEL